MYVVISTKLHKFFNLLTNVPLIFITLGLISELIYPLSVQKNHFVLKLLTNCNNCLGWATNKFEWGPNLNFLNFSDDIPILDKKDDSDPKNLESISEENPDAKPKPVKESSGIKVPMPKLPSLVKKKTSDAKGPKPNKKKVEIEEQSDEVMFSPDSDSQDGESFDIKAIRDSLV